MATDGADRRPGPQPAESDGAEPQRKRVKSEEPAPGVANPSAMPATAPRIQAEPTPAHGSLSDGSKADTTATASLPTTRDELQADVKTTFVNVKPTCFFSVAVRVAQRPAAPSVG